jgi:hypothetical protein
MNGPRLARLLLERWVAPHWRDQILGDLAELYADDRTRHHRLIA